MQLFWPTADEANTRWVKKGEHYSETPDPLDSTHISVIIQPEFDQKSPTAPSLRGWESHTGKIQNWKRNRENTRLPYTTVSDLFL
jgi:hypothetical protein